MSVEIWVHTILLTPLYTELQFDTMELRVEMALRADERRTVDEESSPLSRRMREFKY